MGFTPDANALAYRRSEQLRLSKEMESYIAARVIQDSREGICWECWGDQLKEESDSVFGDLM